MREAPNNEIEAPIAALNERLLSVYLEELRSPNPSVRKKGVRGLTMLGAVATSAIPTLKRIAEQDFDRRVRVAATEALERLGAVEAG